MLGVPRDADAKAIKDAFRALALKFHPDRNKDPGAEERFKEIAEAYAVLSDTAKRREYDAGGFAGVAGYSPQDLFGYLRIRVRIPDRLSANERALYEQLRALKHARSRMGVH